MSQNLYYEVVRPSNPSNLGDGLKWAIRKTYGHEHVFTSNEIPWLQGVWAASQEKSETAKDCETLIQLIQESHEVRVWME